MKRVATTGAVIVLCIALVVGCSTGPAVCPEMGIVVSVQEPGSCLHADTRVGTRAPDFTWEMVNCRNLETTGQTVSLSDLQGKQVVVAFHKRHGCPGCQQQAPHIQAVYDERADTNLAVLTVYRGDNASQVRSYLANQGYMLPALADANDKVGSKYGFGPGAPITVFIDADGIIRAEKQGPLQNQDEIESILDSL